MWLLQGRFAEDNRRELSKLLKYGQTYTLGRKIPADIVIDSKFVSRVSCHITVASQDTIANKVALVTDPLAFHSDLALRPRVTIRFEANKSRKTFGVTQQPDSSRRTSTSEPTEVQVPADQEHQLNDGDSFALTTTISLRLVWKPVAVCFAAKVKETAISPLRKTAQQLGIYLSPAKSRWRDGYTHLCLAHVKPTESVLCALLQARPIVTIDYFQELFCRAELPRHDPHSLETCFEELDFATYQPAFDQQELCDLPDMQQKLLPQERRTYMLKGTTCVLFALPDEESELAIYKRILSVAGAHVFTYSPQAENLKTKADFAQLLMPHKNSALSYWRNSGSKARSEAPDEGLVVLVSAVHDHTPWKDACIIACANLRIAMPGGFHSITNAVFAADVRAHLNSIPNMADGQEEQEEPPEATAAAAVQSTTQRAAEADGAVVEHPAANASATPAAPAQLEESHMERPVAPPEEPPTTVTEPPDTSSEASRRPLTRRTRKPTHDVEAADTDRMQETGRGDEQPANNTTDPQAGPHLIAEPASSQLTRAERSGLTRRTGASRARRSDIFDAMLQTQGSAAAGAAGRSESIVESVGAAVPRSSRYRMDLDEEDRAQSESFAPTQGLESQRNANKRKSPPQRQPSGDSIIPETDAGAQKPASKRARTAGQLTDENGEADPAQSHQSEAARVVRADGTNDYTGLSNGAQPDSEPQFLQALNTQRAKGKKMDDFDVEFNRLQIAKPNPQAASGSLDKFLGSRSGRTGGQQQRQTSNSNAGHIDEDYEAFKRMAEEELRIHVRGNFVQVDFVPLVRQKKANEESQAARPSNADVPNFKRFRPKNATASGNAATRSAATTVSHKPQIALVLPEGNDYGLGQSYWEEQGGQSVPAAESLPDSRGSRSSRRTGKQRAGSDDEFVQPSRSKEASRGRVALDAGSIEETVVDLGLDGLDSLDSEDEADMTTMLERRHGSRSQRSGVTRSSASAAKARGRKRPAALVEDSDDETIQASGVSEDASRKKRASARTSTMLIESDDDGGSGGDGNGNGDHGDNFAGFDRSTSTRRRRDPLASGTARTRRSVF